LQLKKFKTLQSWVSLDVALKKHIELSKNSTVDVTFSMTNVYSRKNIFYVDRITTEKVYQLPLLPSLGASWKF
jgi:hypothetical protein